MECYTGENTITQRKKARTATSMIHESLKKNSHAFILVFKIRQICSPQITSFDGFQPPSHKKIQIYRSNNKSAPSRSITE